MEEVCALRRDLTDDMARREPARGGSSLTRVLLVAAVVGGVVWLATTQHADAVRDDDPFFQPFTR